MFPYKQMMAEEKQCHFKNVIINRSRRSDSGHTLLCENNLLLLSHCRLSLNIKVNNVKKKPFKKTQNKIYINIQTENHDTKRKIIIWI